MNEEELGKVIPKTAKEFRLENSIIKLTKSNGEPSGLIFKNKENNHNTHYHVYQKDGKPFFHQTLEQKGKNIHYSIDIEKMLQMIGQGIEKMFSLAKKVELTNEMFLGKNVILGSNFDMNIKKSTNKKVEFEQLYDLNETIFEKIDLTRNSVGSIWEGNNETHMIFVKNGLVYVIDLNELDKMATELDDMMNSL
ncbi:MAG: hypothetical protein KGZ34_07110 [Nitrosarchaeum sp.]|nr:hypothetical protein [Nitrosarchaeum sp.]